MSIPTENPNRRIPRTTLLTPDAKMARDEEHPFDLNVQDLSPRVVYGQQTGTFRLAQQERLDSLRRAQTGIPDPSGRF